MIRKEEEKEEGLCKIPYGRRNTNSSISSSNNTNNKSSRNAVSLSHVSCAVCCLPFAVQRTTSRKILLSNQVPDALILEHDCIIYVWYGSCSNLFDCIVYVWYGSCSKLFNDYDGYTVEQTGSVHHHHHHHRRRRRHYVRIGLDWIGLDCCCGSTRVRICYCRHRYLCIVLYCISVLSSFLSSFSFFIITTTTIIVCSIAVRYGSDRIGLPYDTIKQQEQIRTD